MSKENVALIVGASGLSGSYIAKLLKKQGWTTVTVSRHAVELPWSDRHIAVESCAETRDGVVLGNGGYGEETEERKAEQQEQCNQRCGT